MAFDPFTATLNLLGGNTGSVADVSPLTRKSNIAQGEFADLVGRSTLLAGGTGVTESQIGDIDKQYLSDTTFTKQSAQTASILGGQNVDQFLKAWRGYVTQRQAQVDTARQQPGAKQTFLGGKV